MSQTMRIHEKDLEKFAVAVFRKLNVPEETAQLAVRSLLDASLMGTETHGIESLEMYVKHIQLGGLKASAEPERIAGSGSLEVWDMNHGFGLASGRKIMDGAIVKAKKDGIYLGVCKNSNHLGACGVYGKMCADKGLIGVVGQQTMAVFSPSEGREKRIGMSPFAFVTPVKNSFPFCFDASISVMTRGKIKEYMRMGKQLPEGVALDSEGNPTTDPTKAWEGEILPIGGYKGTGLAMMFEILNCVLSGNQFSLFIPSIVNSPDKSADSGVFMLVINPEMVMKKDEFEKRMRDYIEYIESSSARNPENPVRYPGKNAGINWNDYRENGIPVSEQGLNYFKQIAKDLDVEFKF